ncbi:MAG: hypothetical protein PHF00_12975, partial [Elusimicrobia bacterium]|nr:hypothetical protein [Elusimicrobiota bacterium]
GQLGFYHDDWVLLEFLTEDGSFWGGMARLAKAGFAVRPLNLPQFALFHAVGGLNPLPYHLAMLLLEITQGLLLYSLLARLLKRRDLALTATGIALLYPNHAVTHYWLSASGQTAALDLALASLLLHSRWQENRRKSFLAAGQACYLLAMLSYESIAFLPLLLGAASVAGDKGAGKPWLQAFRSALLMLAPYGITLAAALFWQRAAFCWVFGLPSQRPVGFSLGHFFKTFQEGFSCLSWRILRLCLRTAPAAWHDFGLGLIAILAGLSWGLARLLKIEPGEGESGRSSRIMAAATGIAAFAAANLPYAFTQAYLPAVTGVMARTSAVGALAGGLLLAAGLDALRSAFPAFRRGQIALLSAFAAACLWSEWHTASRYALSWRIQNDLLAKCSAKAAALPHSATVLVAGVPGEINTRLNPVVVFAAHYDIGGALRLASGRPDLTVNIVSPRMQFTEEAAVESWQGRELARYPYGNLFIYRYDRDEWRKPAAPPAKSSR